MNADGTNQVRLTDTLENDDAPVWSRDVTKLCFAAIGKESAAIPQRRFG
jgi:Tol biopolymer transport system component